MSRFAHRPDRREFCATSTKFKLDMLMMYAVHDAFRRDLERVAEMTTRSEGWEVFGHFLRVHHEAEASFDPSYESLPLEEFEPLLRQVFVASERSPFELANSSP